jgi:hypothetical protein
MAGEFSLQGFSTRLEQGLKELTGRTAGELWERVAGRTPLDTGRARAGWQQSGSGLEYQVSNNVPYITALEHGHSSQAPQGMVGITMLEAPALVERIASEVLK